MVLELTTTRILKTNANIYLIIQSFTPTNKKLFVFNKILFIFLILEARYENFEKQLNF